MKIKIDTTKTQFRQAHELAETGRKKDRVLIPRATLINLLMDHGRLTAALGPDKLEIEEF